MPAVQENPAAHPLTIGRSLDDAGTPGLALAGELDAGSAARLDAAVAEMRPHAAPIAVDIAGLTFLDSAGLRALLNVRQGVIDDTGHPIALQGVNDEQYKLLELCGLLDAFGLEHR